MPLQTMGDFLYGIALAQGRYSHPLSLAPHHAQVYSQNGEDGIIAEIFARIGVRDHTFVEIGVENGLQNNTRFLLEQGWRGLWIDGNAELLAQAREIFTEYLNSGALTIIEARVTSDNVNDLVGAGDGRLQSVDFLSVDVDQNTSHIWRALTHRSRVACIEYNASIPASVAVEVSYETEKDWDFTNWFGASLKMLEMIASAKGMSLVGCEYIGVNAFFVDLSDAVGRFQGPFTAETHWEPPRYSLVQHAGHKPSPNARRWLVGKPQGK